MTNDYNYNESFEIDPSDIPNKCPICGREFDPFEKFVDIDCYENGYRDVLCCGNCNFKKVLSYTTEDDIAAQMQEEYENY